MPNVTLVKNAFNGGELSPQMVGRSDLPAYQHAVRRMYNWLPRPTGGIEKRPGSLFVWQFPDSTKLGRLATFIYDRTKAYALLFIEGKFFVFLDGAPVLTQAHDILPADVDDVAEQFDIADSGYFDGAGPFHLSTTGALPAGLTAGTDYYVRMMKSFFFDDGDVTHGTETIALPAHQLTPESGPFQIYALTDYIPAGLTTNTNYWVYDCPTVDTIRLSNGKGGGLQSFTGDGLGDMELRPSYLPDMRGECAFALTPTGDPIPFVGQGTGVHTITPQTDQPIEVEHPYTEAQLFTLSYSQVGDLMWITDGSHEPRRISRYNDWCWQLDYAPIEDGPYLAQQEYEPGNLGHAVAGLNTLMNPSAVGPGNSITVTASQSIFQSSDIGRLLRICFDTTATPLSFGWAKIREIIDSTHASVDCYAKWHLANGQNNEQWHLSPWSNKLGWPRLVALHHQRVWYASTSQLITFLWATQGGSLSSMAPDEEWDLDSDYPKPGGSHILTDASAISYNVMIDQVNGFNWLMPLETLILGAGGGVMRLAASELNEALTPDNPRVERVSRIGCAEVMPVQLDDAAIFVAQDGKSIMATIFDEDRQKMRPHNLQRLTSHLLTSEVVDLAATPYPFSSFWACREAGNMNNAVLDTRESVLAWSTQELAPTLGGDAIVESMTGLEGVADGNDELWMVVQRTINGATVRMVERLAPRLAESDSIDEGVYMDSAIKSIGTPTSTITLGHLPNETARVMVDGARHADVLLDASGQGTLDDTYDNVTAGLAYRAECDLLPVELPPQTGYRLSLKTKRIVEFVIRVVRTLGLLIGPTAAAAHPLAFRTEGDLMDHEPPLFTGDIKLPLEGGYDRDGVMSIVSDGPHPAEITELAVKVEFGA